MIEAARGDNKMAAGMALRDTEAPVHAQEQIAEDGNVAAKVGHKTPTSSVAPELPVLDDAARQVVSALPSASNPSDLAPSKSKDKRSPSRKRSASEAEKGKAIARENTEKRQKCAAPNSNPASMLFRHDGVEPIYNDAKASTSLFSKIKSLGDPIPPADTLSEGGLYADMYLCGIKVMARTLIFKKFLSDGSDVNSFLYITVRGIHQLDGCCLRPGSSGRLAPGCGCEERCLVIEEQAGRA